MFSNPIHPRFAALVVCAALGAGCSSQASLQLSETGHTADRLMYPTAPASDVVDVYHGKQIADPYRTLEDPDAPRTRVWIEAQNEITRAYIDAIPSRTGIETRLTELWNYERYGLPSMKAGRYFYTRNDGLQNQAVLYVADRLDATPRVLLDPNALAKDGTIALTAIEPSKDGTLLAYALSEAGSDWTKLRVRDIATGKDTDDSVGWVKFSGLAWTHDGRGFFYSTYPDHDTSGKVALKHHRLMYHRLGTPQAQDELVYARPDQPEWGFGGTVTADGEMLVISIWQGTEQKNRVYTKDLRTPASEVVRLLDGFDAEYDFVGKRGNELYFKTDLNAARGRVIAIDTQKPQRMHWRNIVAEHEDTLENVLHAGGRLIASYLQDAHSEVRVHALDGALEDTIELPGLGSIAGIDGDPDETEVFFGFTGFTLPTSIYRYDVAAEQVSTFRTPKVDFDPSDYETTQTFYASQDGTRIPLFVTHRKDVHPSPSTPLLLYGYGGFNIPMKPAFSTSNLVWMERGGVFAVACLRGGGEYGRGWHLAGTKERKQNVFDDFIAAAEHLIAQKMTSPAKLAIRGGSNGGLLVGACITQRPELFGAALPAVGVLDMLRFHKFTIGWGWVSDYGSADDPTAFPYLLAYSPLHNLRAGTCYPPTLITTGDHDDRVVPAHSFKFAAAMQKAQGCANPVLIRIETRGGHGAGKPTAMQIEEIADQWAFLERALGLSGGSAIAGSH